jgi:hypothetical protein
MSEPIAVRKDFALESREHLRKRPPSGGQRLVEAVRQFCR